MPTYIKTGDKTANEIITTPTDEAKLLLKKERIENKIARWQEKLAEVKAGLALLK
jgi:hypothetical protein